MYRMLLLTIAVMIGSIRMEAQFPKVPADMIEYNLHMKTLNDLKIQSRSDWKFILESGVLTTKNYKEKTLKYDALGRLKETEIMDKNGYTQSIVVEKYDSRNLPIMETEFLPTGELIGKTKFTYNSGGILQDITWFNENEFIIRKNTYEVDESMQILIEKQFISPDSAVKTTLYFYSDLRTGFLKEEWNYKGEKKLDYKRIIKRNSDSKIESEEYRDADGKVLYYLKFNFDPKGYPMETLKFFPDGNKLKKNSYSYNANGLITGDIEYNQRGSIIQYRKYSYDQ